MLIRHGFSLRIPTHTLADALTALPGTSPPQHIQDCDTASLIYMSIARQMGFSTSLVEITLSSGSGHNYVRWHLEGGESLDWDTNGQTECKTPERQVHHQGESMSPEAMRSYFLSVRASTWAKQGNLRQALDDSRQSVMLSSHNAQAHSYLAWLIVTHQTVQDRSLLAEALTAANRALELRRSPLNLDTMACVQAATGDFEAAIKNISEALARNPAEKGFQDRLRLFRDRKNCVGQ